ncbi:hypothetical protein DLM75_23755 [Leptospira stimsonii]|uniref:Uncharacterized protein n=1 Tax=Leptospira stimsonii TaxID=2202203 RepID=A0A396YQS6_9LEPT|nr:hypothetical protein DLM75_23755 [Leptospira stimsonii]
MQKNKKENRFFKRVQVHSRIQCLQVSFKKKYPQTLHASPIPEGDLKLKPLENRLSLPIQPYSLLEIRKNLGKKSILLLSIQ